MSSMRCIVGGAGPASADLDQPPNASSSPARQQPNQDQELSRRDGASHLSLLVQRNLAQRKHTPPLRPARCAGFAEPAGFSEGASCPRGKRRPSMCGALRVCSAASAATEGPPGSRERQKTKSKAKIGSAS